MATLTLPDATIAGVRSRHLIGRSRAMHTRIDRPDVSAQHAVIAWMGGRWCIRDLGSRNGTWVNGQRIATGRDHLLSLHDRITCGTDGDELVLSADDAPGPFAVSDAGRVVVGEDDALGIPNLEDPELLIQPAQDGEWVAEGDAGPEPFVDGGVVTVDGVQWTLVLPEPIAQTVERRDPSVSIATIGLSFRVSQDEEFVEIDVRLPGGQATLPARAHHYTTLLLARARMADASAAVAPAEQGWVHAVDLQQMLRQSAPRINLSLHRARRELEELGVINPHDLFERRSTSRQVRIGVADLSETSG